MRGRYDSGGDYSGSASVLSDVNRTVLLTVSSSSGHVFLASPSDRLDDPYLTSWDYVGSPPNQPLFTPSELSRDPTELLPVEVVVDLSGSSSSDGGGGGAVAAAIDATTTTTASSSMGYQMFVGTQNGTALWEVANQANV